MLLVGYLALTSLLYVAADMPSEIKACNKGSNEYSKCMSGQVENAVHLFKNGFRKFGMLSLDPLHVDYLLVDQGSGPVSIKLELKDIDFKGFGNLKTIDVKNDWKKMKLKVFVDHVDLIGKYRINGKVLILPIQGEGPCTINFEKTEAIVTINFKQIEKKGKKHFLVTAVSFDLFPKKVVMNFENLFKGDKALGDTTNRFLNENWEQIINELKPALSKAFSEVVKQVSNQVFSRIPAEELDK